MKRIKKITVKTKRTATTDVKLNIDRETAETCLRLVEVFVNENPVSVEFYRQENGKLKFVYLFHEVKEYGKQKAAD